MFEKRIEKMKKCLQTSGLNPERFADKFHFVWNQNQLDTFTAKDLSYIHEKVFNQNVHPNRYRKYLNELSDGQKYGLKFVPKGYNRRYKYRIEGPVPMNMIEIITKKISKRNYQYVKRSGRPVIVPTGPAPAIQSSTPKNVIPNEILATGYPVSSSMLNGKLIITMEVTALEYK